MGQVTITLNGRSYRLWCGEGEAARARAGLNALWHDALVNLAQIGKVVGRRENAAFYMAWACELQRRFSERFRDPHTGALYSALSPEGPVRGASPDQWLALSLPVAMLEGADARQLFDVLERELFDAANDATL